MEITCAEALVRCLELEGVELVFGYPGGAILPVYDALNDSKIKHILTRHEQGAAHAASGYARTTGKVGVCMATSGPGATNLVTGLANAYMDSIPLVAITGQVPTSQVGTDAFQEVDITGITIPITKHNYLVKDAKTLPLIVRRAFHIARTGRPGPVLIDLPKDVANTRIKFNYPEEVHLKGYKPTVKGHIAQINQAAKLMMQAERPVIYAGGGVVNAEASEELVWLAETLDAPVVTTLMGLGAFPGDHRLFLGMPGLHGNLAANLAVTHSDLLITLGARFDDRVTGRIAGFAPGARVIHVDIDPAEISKNVISHLPIVGDTKKVLTDLLVRLDKKQNPGWIEQVSSWKEEHAHRYQQEGELLKPQYVIEEIYRHSKGDVIVSTDVGQHQMWVAQHFPFKEPRALVTSGGLGVMGFGLPGAIGAQIGRPEKTVVLVTGDGSFQMSLNELSTAAEQELPLKIVVLNNRCLGMVRQLQEFYCEKRYTAVDFGFVPDFAALARVYGFKGYTVNTAEELQSALTEAFQDPGPVLIDCSVDPNENVLPMVLAGKDICDPV
ncbi:biosynthetic-type acetolactate synthase large subunit [Desulforamulus ruminis]|uniref:Acetolactate synthase n=1 Tax=Desulforamulus ruminis (strain ATCC 23193 / DSM 2154 / NCIMB 8452 / DL) TaxID=696281 RepID=F6DPI4_DESRL|nr:biosynthetic-type acetolactate synthase large subunit [Desulforamulus ruminis]AEG58657.1 acetolactate synthase, large subunit, biosynthetic type [Desulforamulus ruminis DSM 2154]